MTTSDAGTCRRSTLEIYQTLKARIQDGYYPPNQKFNQPELADEFGVSRTPVIKALGMLEAEELVDNIPQRGYFIHELTVKDLLEIYQIREAMDVAVVKDILRHITDGEVAELHALFSRFTGQTGIDVREYAKMDMQFHNRLYVISQNRTVIKLQQHFGIGYRYYRAGFAFPPKDTLPEHLAIIEAIRQRDYEQTVMLMSKHARKTTRKIEELADYLIEIRRDPAQVPIGEFQLL